MFFQIGSSFCLMNLINDPLAYSGIPLRNVSFLSVSSSLLNYSASPGSGRFPY